VELDSTGRLTCMKEEVNLNGGRARHEDDLYTIQSLQYCFCYS
jgi:hypothetical protein